MKYLKSSILLFIMMAMIYSCQQEEKTIIADRIQYDVNIKSPDPDYDWWIQNLPGPQREKLVNNILNGALSGKYQAYDYFSNPISSQEVASIMSDTTFLTLVNQEPPYDEKDTIVVYTVLPGDVQRIRFLEEWKMNMDDLTMEKKVIGIAPVAKRIDFAGNERWQPLFWIYTDKDFISELEKFN